MHISFNTEDLTDLDKQVLAVLAGGATAPAPSTKAAADAIAERVQTATKAPAKKAAPAPDPEPEDETNEATLEDAKARAMDLVANGGAPKVKAALKKVGAAKVTEMSEDQVPEFMATLDALEAEDEDA